MPPSSTFGRRWEHSGCWVKLALPPQSQTQTVLGTGNPREWMHPPNSTSQGTSPNLSMEAKSQTHLTENELVQKAEGRGTAAHRRFGQAASLAVGEPRGVVLELWGWAGVLKNHCQFLPHLLKITSSRSLLPLSTWEGSAAPHPVVRPCWNPLPVAGRRGPSAAPRGSATEPPSPKAGASGSAAGRDAHLMRGGRGRRAAEAGS